MPAETLSYTDQLIADAKRIARCTTVDQQRAYLESTGSSYASHPDLLMVACAILGRTQAIAAELADRLEQEIACHA